MVDDEHRRLKWPPGSATHPDLRAALDAFAREDDDLAISLCRPLAEAGHVPAQHDLGCYLLAKDASEAERWLRLAAADEYPPAAHNLAVHLSLTGRQDEAREWFQKAVDLGFEQSISTNPYWWRRDGA